jgi:hypothetical protein
VLLDLPQELVHRPDLIDALDRRPVGLVEHHDARPVDAELPRHFGLRLGIDAGGDVALLDGRAHPIVREHVGVGVAAAFGVGTLEEHENLPAGLRGLAHGSRDVIVPLDWHGAQHRHGPRCSRRSCGRGWACGRLWGSRPESHVLGVLQMAFDGTAKLGNENRRGDLGAGL